MQQIGIIFIRTVAIFIWRRKASNIKDTFRALALVVQRYSLNVGIVSNAICNYSISSLGHMQLRFHYPNKHIMNIATKLQ